MKSHFAGSYTSKSTGAWRELIFLSLLLQTHRALWDCINSSPHRHKHVLCGEEVQQKRLTNLTTIPSGAEGCKLGPKLTAAVFISWDASELLTRTTTKNADLLFQWKVWHTKTTFFFSQMTGSADVMGHVPFSVSTSVLEISRFSRCLQATSLVTQLWNT